MIDGLLEYTRNEYLQMKEYDFSQNPQELRDHIGLLRELRNMLMSPFEDRRDSDREPAYSRIGSSKAGETLRAFSLNSSEYYCN